MATFKLSRQEKARWQRMFTLAERLDVLCPWEWMGVADCFGLLFQGRKEPCFAVFGGQPKTFRHVRFLMGWKAFYDMMTRLADPSRQTPTWLLEIPMIELLYVEPELLFDHERKWYDALKRPVATDSSNVVFRSIIPGYHPWLPDTEELDVLEAALYQAYGMAMRVESDGLLLKSEFPRKILMRKQDKRGDWRDCWSEIKPIADEEVEVRLAGDLLQELKDKPLWPMTVQIDLVFTPLMIGGDGARPQTAYVLLAVDVASGMVIAEELFLANEGIPHMWALIPERLLAIFKRLGGCPETIEVGCDRMANLLRPLGEILPFKMVRRERLSALESAREKIQAYMKQGEAKP
ncbi:MAG TPA: hypothetical protein P5026_09495 [Kiritimatiellia bacterium]|nr:hypothetical protein [Kiritimatiellia bacterium]HRU71079.1 hypothetical protein [Kiritimatiellia bacterium]